MYDTFEASDLKISSFEISLLRNKGSFKNRIFSELSHLCATRTNLKLHCTTDKELSHYRNG